jgi:16S rRNA (cytidine1402-2'-O)-methyltransferase
VPPYHPKDASSTGRLSIVATPIGNLEDITLRALRVLKEADLILAEDTRRTAKLCKHYQIETPLRPFHAHSNAQTVARCLQELMDGSHLALVSDAGTPLINDPGAELAKRAAEHAVAIESIPGPSALTAALTAAAYPFDRFWFLGFFPRAGASRKQVLEKIAREPAMVVFFESPHRLARTLADLAKALDSARQLAVCRELTKIHEQVARGTASELADQFRGGTLGEVTVVIEAREPEPIEAPPVDLDARILACLEQGMSARDIARELCRQTGQPRRAIYGRVLALSAEGAPKRH